MIIFGDKMGLINKFKQIIIVGDWLKGDVGFRVVQFIVECGMDKLVL